MRSGSLRWLFADDDRVVYLRETVSELVLIHLARAPGSPINLPGAVLGLQAGVESESLYANDMNPWKGGSLHLSGHGPGVWIWRFERAGKGLV